MINLENSDNFKSWDEWERMKKAHYGTKTGFQMIGGIPSGKEIPRPTDVCRFVLRISGLRTLIRDGECHSLFSQ